METAVALFGVLVRLKHFVLAGHPWVTSPASSTKVGARSMKLTKSSTTRSGLAMPRVFVATSGRQPLHSEGK